MDLGLKGRACVVTGASRGIGLSTARMLCGEGADVLLVARSEDALLEAADECAAAGQEAGGRAESLVADVTDPAAADRIVKEAADRLGQRTRGYLEHRVRRTGRRPYGCKTHQVRIHERIELRRMPERRDATNRVAGDLADVSRIRPFQLLAQVRRDALLVDAVLARDQQQLRFAAGLAAKHQRFDDLRDVAATGAGGFLGAAGNLFHRPAQFLGLTTGEAGGHHGHPQQLLLKQRHAQRSREHGLE